MLVVPSGPLIWIFTLLHQEPLDINIVSSVRGPQAAAPPPVFLLRSESCFVALQRDRERETDRQTDTKKRKIFYDAYLSISSSLQLLLFLIVLVLLVLIVVVVLLLLLFRT